MLSLSCFHLENSYVAASIHTVGKKILVSWRELIQVLILYNLLDQMNAMT